ncbi:hypothetical protein, partial [Ruminococcus albus]|uniref:hypothetical protein n=1 Tax=Ruminococcus albus TaxID=1264 RepID=UPI001A9A538A
DFGVGLFHVEHFAADQKSFQPTNLPLKTGSAVATKGESQKGVGKRRNILDIGVWKICGGCGKIILTKRRQENEQDNRLYNQGICGGAGTSRGRTA